MLPNFSVAANPSIGGVWHIPQTSLSWSFTGSRHRLEILLPQTIHHELDNTIMSTTTNVVSHVNVEQSKRPILFRMKRESTFVGIGVDFTLDGRTFWRLSHFHFLFSFFFSLTLISTLYHAILSLQEKSDNFIVKRF